MGEEYNYACGKCPRTFKLQEFYDKHQKVHLLKKQHVCTVCGFVYGAAKGLEGHMESAHGKLATDLAPATFNNNNNNCKVNHNTAVAEEEEEEGPCDLTNKPPTVRPKLSPAAPMDLSQSMPEMPFLHFLQAQGVLSSADLLKQAQQAMLAQMTASHQAQAASRHHSCHSHSVMAPITISAPTSPNTTSPNSALQQKPNDKSKIPSPAGTGNYKIYDEVPEIQDASDAQQNDSGFFSCTICSREFSGLNSLKKHVPIHTRRVQHKCDTCGYVFGKKEYLLDHMRKHTGEISPVCEVCGQTFNKSLKLKEHLKLHRNTAQDGNLVEHAPYRCHICKQCFSRPEPLGDHLRSAHSETVYKCDMCDATFGDVRGKNHHMYNEHQLDAFHQKCVWCPVCNQGFTRHYNLKVHMYKSHGKEYLENNFSSEELDAIMRPPPGSNTSKPSPTPRKRPSDEQEIVLSGAAVTASPAQLPISPPLTPKLSPKQRREREQQQDSPTMVPSNSVIPSANILKANLQRSGSRPGPASLTKPQHYFDQEAQHAMLKCQLCAEKFLRKSDLFIHLQQHGVRIIGCQLCEDKFLDVADLKRHLTSAHGQAQDSGDSDGEPGLESPVSAVARRPGPASRTNAPKENRGSSGSNLPGHLATTAENGSCAGFPCEQCGKVLMHKQSYVSHMRVIHGDYYGGNKWRGSSVVEMVLGGQKQQRQETAASRAALSPHRLGLACEFCPKAFTDQAHLDDHIQSKHPNLTKRIQAFKAALGLNDSDEPDTKRIKLDYKAPAHLSASPGYDEPLDLACKPVSLNVDIEEDEADQFAGLHDSNNNHNNHCNVGNNLLQIARPLPVASSPPCSPLNLHISRPHSPSQVTSQPRVKPCPSPAPSLPQPSSQALPLPPPPQPPHEATEHHTPGGGQDTEPPASGPSDQPKLHEYLVKQSNATSDENGRKKFLCPVCKCQLSWKTNLSVHLRTHSGERPFQCVLCLNRFRQKAHLYKHFRCSHGHKLAPYKCMFCTESFTRSPNDLYNHITEVHKRETDEITNNNNTINNNNNIKSLEEEKMEEKSKDDAKAEDLSQVKPAQESDVNNIVPKEAEEEDDEHEDDEDEFEPTDRNDDTRFEAIQEEFEFDGKLIKPSYCVLPFITDDEVEACTKRNIAEYYEQPEEYSEDEEGQMVIDESPQPSPENLILTRRESPPPAPVNNNFNNNELKINSFGQGFANAINICRKEEPSVVSPQPTHTVKFEPLHHAAATAALYYPAVFPDFSLPFSLSGLIQKKKAEMAAILAPRLSPKTELAPSPVPSARSPGCHASSGHAHPHKLTLDHLAKAALISKSALSPAKSDSAANNTAVSEYENQIQNDLWPVDCIKCHAMLTSLDNFNIHMNDHWSDDKCCPVCGLLINSKRFNFKQHLKIHTGEKPFVCQVCNRAFRQKAHMVKHVTTHRSEPRGMSDAPSLVYSHPHGPVTGAGAKLSMPGVIVQ